MKDKNKYIYRKRCWLRGWGLDGMEYEYPSLTEAKSQYDGEVEYCNSAEYLYTKSQFEQLGYKANRVSDKYATCVFVYEVGSDYKTSHCDEIEGHGTIIREVCKSETFYMPYVVLQAAKMMVQLPDSSYVLTLSSRKTEYIDLPQQIQWLKWLYVDGAPDKVTARIMKMRRGMTVFDAQKLTEKFESDHPADHISDEEVAELMVKTPVYGDEKDGYSIYMDGQTHCISVDKERELCELFDKEKIFMPIYQYFGEYVNSYDLQQSMRKYNNPAQALGLAFLEQHGVDVNKVLWKSAEQEEYDSKPHGFWEWAVFIVVLASMASMLLGAMGCVFGVLYAMFIHDILDNTASNLFAYGFYVMFGGYIIFRLASLGKVTLFNDKI